MSEVIGSSKKKKKIPDLENLIGPTDSKIDNQARERLVGARIKLLLKHSFFGNLATRLKLRNADEWCSTAATDGRYFYYNSRFIMKLRPGEVEFLFGHEVLHVVYDHMGRRGQRDPQLWNIADDYAVNADLKRHKIGEFITTVPCLYESKYDRKSAEEIYEDLMKNVHKIDIDDLLEQIIDQHLDDNDDGSGSGSDGDKSDGKNGPEKMTKEEKEQLRQEIKQNIIAAAKSAGAGDLPAGVSRIVKDITEPKMPWRELIATNLTSAIRTDYSFMRPSRRSWHMDAIMPGMNPGEEVELAVALDMSGSISAKDAGIFLSEVKGIMQSFDSYKIHVFCFDTEVYNMQDFNSDNLDSIEEYELKGGGGTNFDCIFDYLKDRGQDIKRLIVFTDMMPFGSWGDPNFCDTTWIGIGSYAKNVTPPFGTWALYDN